MTSEMLGSAAIKKLSVNFLSTPSEMVFRVDAIYMEECFFGNLFTGINKISAKERYSSFLCYAKIESSAIALLFNSINFSFLKAGCICRASDSFYFNDMKL